MSSDRPAFGEMLAELVELGAIEFRPEPLDPGLEQAARTYGFVRSLNLADAPLHILVSCIAVGGFR